MNHYAILAIEFSIGVFVASIMMPLAKKLAFRFEILDHPGERKVHSIAIPYLGGIGIFSGFIASLLWVSFTSNTISHNTISTLLIASTLIFSLGLFDDAKGTKPFVKLILQIFIACFVVYNDIDLKLLTNPFGAETLELGWFGKVVSVIWIIAITNAINLLDGLDGLAGGVSGISILFMIGFAIYAENYILAFLLVSLLSGITGFLFFNFPPASIFMGDAGSLLIGFLFSVFCLMADVKGPYTFTILVPMMLLSIPIFDTLLAIIRRAKNRTGIFNADKRHLHHRLLNLGNSYKRTLMYIYLINIIIGAIATLTFFLPNKHRIYLLVLLIQDIFLGLLLLRSVEEKRKLLKKVEELEK